MKDPDGRKVDSFELCIRFLCGALLGSLLTIRLVLYWYGENPIVLIMVGTVVILACGLAAARYGDKFWYSLR